MENRKWKANKGKGTACLGEYLPLKKLEKVVFQCVAVDMFCTVELQIFGVWI
jgi:hypothetical protein